jgi:hypothetical protein
MAATPYPAYKSGRAGELPYPADKSSGSYPAANKKAGRDARLFYWLMITARR